MSVFLVTDIMLPFVVDRQSIHSAFSVFKNSCYFFGYLVII